VSPAGPPGLDRKTVRVLLIEDSPTDARIVCRALDEGRSYRFEVEQATRLSQGLQRLAQGGIDALVLDLTLPDSQGFQTFEAAFAAAGDIPILVLTGLDDEDLAARAVRAGAQDYLPKETLGNGLLPRALRHAIERKEFERELERSNREIRQSMKAQERLTAILEAATDFIGIATPEGKVLYMNRAGRAMVGRNPDEDLLGTDIDRYSPEWATRAFYEECFPVAARDGVWTGRSAFLGADGREIPVWQVIVAHKNGDGLIEYFSTIARDISERLQAEEALRESATRLRILIEQMPAVLWTTDARLRFASIQGAGLAAMGLQAGEVEGKRLLDFYPEGSGGQALQAHQRALRGESVAYEQRWQGRVFESHVEPLRDTGDRIVGCIALDVTDRKQAEERMRTLTKTLEALVEASPLAIVTFDAESRVTLWSPAAERTFGWQAEEVMGKRLPLVPDDKLDEHLSLCDSVLAGRRFTGLEVRRRDNTGAPLDLRISVAPLRDGHGRICGVAEFLEDINDRKRAERAIRRLASMPEQSPDPLIELDLAGNALYVNQAARSRFPDLQALGSWHPVLGNLSSILARFRHGERKSFSFEVSHEQRIYHQMAYYIPEGSLVRVFLSDVTEQRHAREILERESLHDRLTGLPNRTLFLRRVEEQIGSAQEEGSGHFAVLSLNLDRFKVVNDSLGQTAGDQLLAAVAQRLSACLTREDTAARLDGDEFAVLLRHTQNPGETLQIAEQIREAVSRSIEISRQEIFPSASLGIAPGESYDDGEALLRDAHLTMHRAKALGGGRCAVFDPAVDSRSLERLRLENGLRRGIERNELRMFYQPIVRMRDGAIVGFEALMRWPRQDQGMVPPAEFIPVAEEAGLISQLSYWALSEVCERLREWTGPAAGGLAPVIHLNLSGRVFSDPNLVNRVRAALAENRLPGERLVLEITESVLMDDPKDAAETLKQIKALNVGLSIDDFGTGYSSLSYLQQFPIDSLKIDRMFVAKIGGPGESPEIVHAILTLAQRLGIEVIAEGVETEAQLAQLLEMGCNLAQGYLFSRPVDGDAARAFLEPTPTWAGWCPNPDPPGSSARLQRAGLKIVRQAAS
jgi:diguanylate cyclase (GGDEF)-like protein/PAS domain S-box-containing protein